MMNDYDRDRRMPISFLISMVLHALLFLIAPHVATGLFSGVRPGDQGGLIYVSLVDVAVPERPRATVAEAARRPQAIPDPRPRPEPQRAPEPTPSPQPAPTPAPERTPVPEVRAELVQEQPQEERPVAVNPATAPPRPEPSAQPVPSPAASEPSQQEEQGESQATAAMAPVLTAPESVRSVPTVSAPPRIQEETASNETTAAETGPPVQSESPAASGETGGSEEGGTGAQEDVSSALPDAEISSEPALPPTGESMVRAAGATGWPKNFVGVLTRTLTIEVAVVVDTQGNVVYAEALNSSGIEYIDDYSVTVASRAITYRPYDEPYEVRVILHYDPEARSLTHRVDGFIRTPPTVGPLAP